MKIFSLLIFLIVLVSVYRTTDFTPLNNQNNIDEVRNLYEKVNKTATSSVNAGENTKIIHDRLECYAINSNYTARFRVCNNAYTKALVQQARKHIRSRPDIGRFVQNIHLCPIMYNLCVGKTENNIERCVEFERQCIDYTLDVYWRGAKPYTPQQYSPE